MLITSNHLVPKGFAAITIGFIIFVRPENLNDLGLIEHEKVHVKQFKRNPLMPLLYLVSCKYRLAYEVEAYKVSIKHGVPLHHCAESLLKYRCGITFEQAQELLLND